MATTKAFELAQLSALTAVDASGNVTTNTSQIANASGDLTLDSVADIILNADGADIILKDDTVDFGRFKRDAGDFVIKSETIDKNIIIKGTTTSNATVTALTFDMANGGRATFNEQIIAQSNITTNRLNIINGTAPYIEFTEGTNVVQMGVDSGNFWIRQNGLSGGDEIRLKSTGELQVNHDATFAGIIDITNSTVSTSSTTGALVVAGGAGITENLYVGGNTVISGDLTVEGTSVTLNTTALDVEDKNITLNYHASNDTSASAGGAGITIQDAVDASTDASILWDATNDEFDVSHNMKIAGSVGVTNIVTNKVVKFNGTILDDSNITDDGTTITASSDFNTSGQMTFTTNAKAIRMRDSNGLYTRSMILNASDVFYIGPVDTYAGGAILYGASADVTDQQFYTGGTLRHVTKSTGDFQWYEDNGGTPQVGMHWDYTDGSLGIGTDTPATALHVDPGYVTLGTSSGTDNSWINNVEDGNLELVNEGRSTNDGAVRINRKNNPAGDTTYFRDTVIYDGKSSVIVFVDGSENKVGIGTDTPGAILDVNDDGVTDNAWNTLAKFRPDLSDQHAEASIHIQSYPSTTVVADRKAGIQSIDDAGNARSLILNKDGGNVGIGTDNPDCALDVTRTSGWAEMHLDGASGGDLLFKDNGVSYGEIYAGNGHGLVIKSYSGQDIYFLTDANATPKMVIESGGNVGIGVDPAVHKLDVDGAIATRQVRHSLKPSLNLDFANSKQLDPRITFYRSSVATYYDNRGILRYATENEPRFDHDPVTGESKGLLIEEARTNIAIGVTNFGIPIDFNGMYNIPNARLAPDGTMSATDVLANNGISRHEVNIKFSGTSGTNYASSFYVKPLGAVTHISVSFAGGSNTCNFDLVNITHGTPGGTSVVTITDAGNGWRRVTLRATESATGTRSIYISPGIGSTSSSVYSNLNGDSLNGVSLWGCQIEAADFATSLVPLDTRFTSRASSATYYDETGIIRTAPADYPRYSYNYDGRKWVETGLILEGSATNKVHQNSIPQSAYQSTNTYGYYAPDGSYKAFQNIPNSGTSPGGAACVIWSNTGFDNTTSKHTISIYAKSVQGFDRVRLHDNNNNKHVVFNLTGMGSFDTATNVDAAHIQFIGNGWYRIGMTYTPSTNTSPYFQMYSMETGNGSGGFQFFGAQTESGDKMTSFIHTTTANVTRAADIYTSISTVREADVAQINGSNIGDWFNQGKGTLYAEGISGDLDTYFPGLIELNKNPSGTSDRIQILGRPSGIISFQIYKDGNPQAIISNLSGNMRTSVLKAALAYDKNDVAFTFSGNSTPYLDTAAEIPYTNYISIGEQNGGYMNGTIKKIAYYPERLSDSEIQALTENN